MTISGGKSLRSREKAKFPAEKIVVPGKKENFWRKSLSFPGNRKESAGKVDHSREKGKNPPEKMVKNRDCDLFSGSTRAITGKGKYSTEQNALSGDNRFISLYKFIPTTDVRRIRKNLAGQTDEAEPKHRQSWERPSRQSPAQTASPSQPARHGRSRRTDRAHLRAKCWIGAPVPQLRNHRRRPLADPARSAHAVLLPKIAKILGTVQ